MRRATKIDEVVVNEADSTTEPMSQVTYQPKTCIKNYFDTSMDPLGLILLQPGSEANADHASLSESHLGSYADDEFSEESSKNTCQTVTNQQMLKSTYVSQSGPQCKNIHDWAVVMVKKELHIEGNLCENDSSSKLYRTSAVVSVSESGKTVMTTSQSSYKLVGDMFLRASIEAGVPFNIATKFVKGIPKDWENYCRSLRSHFSNKKSEVVPNTDSGNIHKDNQISNKQNPEALKKISELKAKAPNPAISPTTQIVDETHSKGTVMASRTMKLTNCGKLRSNQGKKCSAGIQNASATAAMKAANTNEPITNISDAASAAKQDTVMQISGTHSAVESGACRKIKNHKTSKRNLLLIKDRTSVEHKKRSLTDVFSSNLADPVNILGETECEEMGNPKAGKPQKKCQTGTKIASIPKIVITTNRQTIVSARKRPQCHQKPNEVTPDPAQRTRSGRRVIKPKILDLPWVDTKSRLRSHDCKAPLRKKSKRESNNNQIKSSKNLFVSDVNPKSKTIELQNSGNDEHVKVVKSSCKPSQKTKASKIGKQKTSTKFKERSKAGKSLVITDKKHDEKMLLCALAAKECQVLLSPFPESIYKGDCLRQSKTKKSATEKETCAVKRHSGSDDTGNPKKKSKEPNYDKTINSSSLPETKKKRSIVKNEKKLKSARKLPATKELSDKIKPKATVTTVTSGKSTWSNYERGQLQKFVNQNIPWTEISARLKAPQDECEEVYKNMATNKRSKVSSDKKTCAVKKRSGSDDTGNPKKKSKQPTNDKTVNSSSSHETKKKRSIVKNKKKLKSSSKKLPATKELLDKIKPKVTVTSETTVTVTSGKSTWSNYKKGQLRKFVNQNTPWTEISARLKAPQDECEEVYKNMAAKKRSKVSSDKTAGAAIVVTSRKGTLKHREEMRQYLDDNMKKTDKHIQDIFHGQADDDSSNKFFAAMCNKENYVPVTPSAKPPWLEGDCSTPAWFKTPTGPVTVPDFLNSETPAAMKRTWCQSVEIGNKDAKRKEVDKVIIQLGKVMSKATLQLPKEKKNPAPSKKSKNKLANISMNLKSVMDCAVISDDNDDSHKDEYFQPDGV